MVLRQVLVVGSSHVLSDIAFGNHGHRFCALQFNLWWVTQQKNRAENWFRLGFLRVDKGTRTPDPRNHNPML